MIGFLPASTTRRPIYSVTGEKLCYLISGPDGEWVLTVAGRKLARITKRHVELSAGASATGSQTIDADYILYED